MSEKVSVELTVEQAQAVRAWMEANKPLVQYADQLKRIEDLAKKASESSKKGFGEATSGMQQLGRMALQVASSYLSIQTAMQLVGREIEANNRRNAAALTQQLDVATMQRQAARALAPKSDLTAASLTQLVESGTKLPLAQQYPAVTAALKEAGRDFSQRTAVETALAAGELAPELDAGQLAELAGGAVDLQKQRRGMSGREAVAQLLRLARFSESKSAAEISRDLVPAISRGQGFGQAAPGALEAFYLALQGQMNVEGVGEAVGVGEKFLKDLSVKGAQAGVFKADASLEQKLAAIQADTPEATAFRKKMLGPYAAAADAVKKGKGTPELTRNAAAFPFLAQLFAPGGGETGRQMAEIQEALRGPALPAEEAQAAKLAALPGQQAAEVQRALIGGIQKYRSEPARALAALEREGLGELLTESGVFATEEQFGQFLRSMAPSKKVEGLQERIAQRRRLIEQQRFQGAPIAGATMGPTFTREVPLSEDAARSVAILQEVEQRLAEIAANQERQMKQATKVELPLQNQPARPGAAALKDGG